MGNFCARAALWLKQRPGELSLLLASVLVITKQTLNLYELFIYP